MGQEFGSGLFRLILLLHEASTKVTQQYSAGAWASLERLHYKSSALIKMGKKVELINHNHLPSTLVSGLSNFFNQTSEFPKRVF